MSAQFAGYLLIASFVALAIAWPMGVPGLYSARNIDEQVRLIEAHRTRFLITQAGIVLYAVLATAGFVALAVNLASSTSAWLPAAGALAIAAGSASGVWFVYLQTTDPRSAYSGQHPVPEVAAYWFWLAGMLLIGVALVLAGPAWLGVLTAAGAAAFIVFYLVTGQGFMTPALTGIVGLVIGIVALIR